MENRHAGAPAPLDFKRRGEQIDCHIEVVTPVYGGGVRAPADGNNQRPERPIDPITPLRGTSIRGQLRFWWRATHGSRLESHAALRDAEDRLWGAASKPGLVDLSVDMSGLAPVASEQVEHRGQPSGLKYGAFATSNLWKVAGTACVRITVLPPCPTVPGTMPSSGSVGQQRSMLENIEVQQSDIEQVRDALYAWLLFGGIGGRTRRGLGAVASTEATESTVSVARALLQRFQPQSTLSDVPSLTGACLVVAGRYASPRAAMQAGLNALRRFRQDVDIARNPSSRGKPAGRSLWPEADMIRHRGSARGRPIGDPNHARRLVNVDKAPRGQFGMPITFHFIGEQGLDKVILLPRGRDRMASPLILRPLRDGSDWVAAALRLSVPGAQGVECRLDKHPRDPDTPVSLELTEAEVSNGGVQPLQGNPDPVAAFLEKLSSLV